MHIVFYSTSDVFKVEEILNDASIVCRIVPTPVSDKAYCGVCLQTENEEAMELMGDIEYEVIR